MLVPIRIGDRAMAHPALQNPDELDRTIELALAEVDGDTLQALRNLVMRQRELEMELSRTVSAGYVRRRPAA